MPEIPPGRYLFGQDIEVPDWPTIGAFDRILSDAHDAILEAMALRPTPGWLVPGGTAPQPKNTVDNSPKIAAEKLLRSILPEELCISLSAINECEVAGKKYRYKLFKNKKTHCIQGDKVFSCCIELEDTTTPDTDRIVSEYLLIKSDEEQYLKTANLTQISGPRKVPRQLHGLAFHPDAFSMAMADLPMPDWRTGLENTDHGSDAMRYAMGVDWATGFSVQVPGPRHVTTRMIVDGLLGLLRRDELLGGRRWPEMDTATLLPNCRRAVLHVDFPILDELPRLPWEDFRTSVLVPVVARLARQIADAPNIAAFVEVDMHGPDCMASAVDRTNGIKLSCLRIYDIRDNRTNYRIAAGVILR